MIVVLEGGVDDRVQRAVELLKNYYSHSDQLIVSPRNVTATLDNADWYFNAGASEEQLIFEYDSTSTWTNALNSLAIIDDLDYDSALIVTTNFHTWRSRMAFE